MIQNMNGDTIEINKKNKKTKIDIFANVFSKQYIFLYIIAIMLSLVGINKEFSIFSISLLGACLSFSVPIFGILVLSLIGNALKFGANGAMGYILTATTLIISLFIIKPFYNEKERNEKIKIGLNIFISTLIIQILKIGMTSLTIYDILSTITLSIIALVFYKIFINTIVVMKNFTEKRAFSIEEVIGTSILLSIAAVSLGKINIFGFCIRNIITILIVMILGWKNGVLVGTTSGVAIGITIGTMTNSDPIMISAYAISGMIAGILNRFGKIGVILGFTIGNILLAYISNGNTVELLHFKEILIASIGLLAVPKTFKLNIEEFVGTNKLFPIISGNALGNSKNVASSLNNVSEAIDDMSSEYKHLLQETKANNKEIFIAELLNTLDPYKDNIIYEDIANTEGEIIEKIFEHLLEKQEINVKELLNIFSECNSYIIGIDDKEISKYLQENLNQMVTIINMSYKVSKSEFIWRKKEEENKKNIGKQLNGISKAIQNIAKGIEKEGKEEGYIKEKKEILTLLENREVGIKDLVIKRKIRYIVSIYLKQEYDNVSKIEKIEEILTLVLKEQIIYDEEHSNKEELCFISEDKYNMAIGKSKSVKDNSQITGDNILNIRLRDGKYLVALSDGMGSGKEANESSKKALDMLENLLLSGFDRETSIDLINTTLVNKEKEAFATLDIAIIDLYKGEAEFIKSGACPTYIKNKKVVKLIKSTSLPTGIIEENKIQSFDKKLENGDIILICSDGILDSNVEYKNKELWLKYMLEDIETGNTQKIADMIMNEAIDNNYGKIKDDMSVIVLKILKK